MADESYAARAIYLAIESAYAAARPADSAYRVVPASGTLEASGGRAPVDTNRFTGRPGRSPRVPGQSSASGSLGIELTGLSAQGGAGAAPVAQDVLDLIMSGVADGTPIEQTGEAVSSLADVTLTLASDTLDADELVCLVDASGAVRWAGVDGDAGGGGYTLDHAPQVGGALMVPTHARATRQWVDSDGAHTSHTFALMYLLGAGAHAREIPGARVSSLSLAFQPSSFALLSVGLEGSDYRTPDVAPAFSVAANGDPGDTSNPANLTGCVYIDHVAYPSATVSVDWQLSIADRSSTCSPSGRVNKLLVEAVPKVSLTTAYLDAWDTVARDLSIHDIKVVSGVEGADGPSTCLWIPQAQLAEIPAAQDDGGFLGQNLAFEAVTAGARPRWLWARS